MVNLIVLGISIHHKSHVPLLLLYPMGTTRLLCLRLDPIEAFSVSKALHGFGEVAKPSDRLLFDSIHESPTNSPFSREEIILKRPMVHDFMLESIKTLGGQLLYVSLIDEKKGCYLAEAVITGPNGIFQLNCRPADAIALALRASVPIRIASALMMYAEEISDIMESLPEHIQNLVRTAMLTHESLLSENIITQPLTNEKDSPLEKHLAMEKVTQFVNSLKSGRLNKKAELTNASGSSACQQSKSSPDTLLAPLSDADEWTEVLSTLTPETKKFM